MHTLAYMALCFSSCLTPQILSKITPTHKQIKNVSKKNSSVSASRLYLNPSFSVMNVGSDQTQPTSPFDGALIS